MRIKTIAGMMLTLLLTSMLTVAFNIPPIIADTGTVGLSGCSSTVQEADGDNPSNLTDFQDNFLSEGFNRNASAKENPRPCSVDEDRWNFNRTNEWADFAKVDGDSTELVIGVNNGKPNSYADIMDLTDENGGDLVGTVSMGGEIRAVVADIPLVAVSSFVAEVRDAGLSKYIEPNMKFQACFVPNDPYWSYQWGPRIIEANYAWNTTIGDPSVLVAVIDTGIDWDHPDLAANYVPLGYDWVNNDTDPMDDEGHGTHCAGIIAAVINNSVGIAGLAQVRIMAEKGLDSGGWGTEDDLANAIIHAVDQGANILSNSWGGYGESALIHEAVKYAYDYGVLVVAAAGNEATSMKLYPAAYDEVIAVTATDEYDNPAWFPGWWGTNFGEWVELAAPGVDIYSTVWDDYYTYMSGTSMSTPHVAGVAALILSQFPNMTRDQVRLQLRFTADDLGDPGFDDYYGYGRINARRAVEQAPPDHDLVILDWERPPYVEPGDVATVSTTVFNFGVSNESDITVQLSVNGSVVHNATVNFLASGESATVDCSWSPTVEGMYNVTSYVVPVSGEMVTENNIVWAYVYVGFPVKAVVLDSAGNYIADIISNWEVLNTNWYLFGSKLIYVDYTSLSIDDITYDDIAATGADVLIISCAYDWEFTDSEIDAITRYVHEGHGLIATAGTLYYWVPNNNKLAPLFGLNETVTWDATLTDLLHIVDPTHPLFVNVPNPYTFRQVVTAVPFDWRWDENELAGGTYVALGHYEECAIVAYRGLVYISPWLEIIPPYYHFHLQLLYNAITWSCYEKPEHELIVHLESPPALKPGTSAMLNATVFNMGLSNETGVELQLIIDGTLADSVVIPELLTGSSYTLSYLWTPTVEATYNVTAYAPPLPDEEFIENNVESATVLVYYMLVALFKNVDPWEYPANEEALSLYGMSYVVLGSGDFGSVDLSLFSKVVIASDQDHGFYYAIDTYRWWFEDYVSNGGLLEIHAADWGWHGGSWVGTLPGGLEWVSYYSDYVTIVDPVHPVVTIPNPITDAELDYWYYSVHGYFGTYPVDSHIVIIEDSTGYPAYLEFKFGDGFIIASSQTLEWAYWHQYSLILENSLLYFKFPHELTVFLEAPAFLEPGDSSLLNATVTSRGLSNETDVELFLLINGTVVNSTTIPELLTGESYTINYLWTPTVEATYNVTAYAPPVPGENVTANNWYTKFIRVGYVVMIGIIETHGETLHTEELANYYTSLGHIVEKIITTITPGVLDNYDIVIVGEFGSDWLPSEIAATQAYIDSGRDFIAIGDQLGTSVQEILGTYGISYTGISAPGGSSSYFDPLHPIMQGVSLIYAGAPVNSLQITAPAYWIANDISDTYILIAGAEFGGYVLCLSNDFAYYLYDDDNEIMFKNIVDWMAARAPPGLHDVAIISVTTSATEVYKGQIVNITVVAKNEGNVTETFNVATYYDTSVIGIQTVTNLTAGANITLTFSWDTVGVEPSIISYTIKAVAIPVPGEIDTADNILIDGTVKVKLLGDVNGDGIVNIKDIGICCKAFGSTPSDPRWDPRADLTGDSLVDIFDLVTIAVNFGARARATYIYVDPPSTTVAVGSTFTVNVNIYDVTDLWLYEFWLFYDTTVLDCVDVTFPPGHFLTPVIDPGNIWTYQDVTENYNATHGRVLVAASLFYPEPAKNGSGVLATITFKATALGGPSALHLDETILADSRMVDIDHMTIDGYVTIISATSTTSVSLRKTHQ